KTKDFENHTRSRTLNNYISYHEDIFNVSKELLESEELKSNLRLIGVSISSFKEKEIEQMTLF
ncbi:DNA polymerase IV, partial [Clostridium butyricum]